jgi:addiction module HigA family antidote
VSVSKISRITTELGEEKRMMSDFIVAPGEIIKEYFDARGLTQKDVAKRIDVSERHLSQLINGKSRLTEDMALKLEKLMPDVPASFWLNYEVKYQEYLAREREQTEFDNAELKDIARRFHFKEVFGRTKMPLVEQAIAMLKILHVSSFGQYRYAVPGNMEFMQDGGDDEAVIVWIKLCEEEAEEQNKDLSEVPFSKERLESSMDRLKMIALNPKVDDSIESARKLFNRCGVYLVVRPAISNSKVRGALATYMGHPAVYISKRYKTHDHVWFTIVHELAHLLLHYDSKQPIVSMEELASEAHRDEEANRFARSFFVDTDDYKAFTETNEFSRGRVYEFAKSQAVDPGIVVGFLQHDGFIEFNTLSDLKTSC